MKATALGLVALVLSGSALAKDPDCAYPDGWSASMASGYLRNAGLLDTSQVDFKKSTVTQIASQRIGKDLYRQIQLVRFVKQNGGVVQAVTTHDASHVECSMSGVDIYPVLNKLGDRSDAMGKPVDLHANPQRRSHSIETPATLARGWLKAAKLVDADVIDQAQVSVSLMGSQRIGKQHRLEVNRLHFEIRDGKPIEAIVVDEVSGPTRLVGKADVYLVSGRLDPCDNLPKGQACPLRALEPPRWTNEREQRANAKGRPLPTRTLSSSDLAKDPDCAYADGWAASMAQGDMRNAGLLDTSQVDFKKSAVTQIASQRIGKDLYRQIQLVRFVKKNGEVVQAITTHDASHVECSMSDVDTYPVRQRASLSLEGLGAAPVDE